MREPSADIAPLDQSSLKASSVPPLAGVEIPAPFPPIDSMQGTEGFAQEPSAALPRIEHAVVPFVHLGMCWTQTARIGGEVAVALEYDVTPVRRGPVERDRRIGGLTPSSAATGATASLSNS